MKAWDWIKIASKRSYKVDEIPVKVTNADGSKILGQGKSLYYYSGHCGLEVDRKLKEVIINKDLITIIVH